MLKYGRMTSFLKSRPSYTDEHAARSAARIDSEEKELSSWSDSEAESESEAELTDEAE